MSNIMTLVTNTLCFAGYRHRALDPELAQRLRAAMPIWLSAADSILLRLECFLQITGQTLRSEQLGTDHARVIFTSWLALLHASLSAEGRMKTAYTFFGRVRSALLSLGDHSLDGFRLPFQKTDDLILNERLSELVASIQPLLIPERVEFWKGWTARNKAKKEVVLRFYPLHERLGAEFTNEFFRVCRDWIATRRGGVLECINALAEYIGQHEGHISPRYFKEDPLWLYEFLSAFAIDLPQRAHERGTQMYATTRQWSKCAYFLEEAVLGRIWGRPSRRLPTPKAPTIRGTDTRIVRRQDGVEVRNALMTDVPLEVSDGEAKEILFKRINSDLGHIRLWARREIAEAWKRHLRRLELAPTGIVTRLTEPGKNTGTYWRLSKIDCPDWLSHAAATFEKRGFVVSNCGGHLASICYPSTLQETTWDLGLPTPNLLLAHASLLVATHPQITSSFLEHIEIVDKNGKDVGFIATDAGYYLVGNKPRRGSSSAEQQVKLNDETTDVVRHVIALTRPLRDFLKARGDPAWRRLFLASPSVGATPKFWCAAGVSSRASTWLADRLTILSGMEEDTARELSKRCTLRSLRASAAVAIFLETGSIQKFADALGHKRVDPLLLDSYLPRPVHQWFVERWIRLFQTGMIVLAMRDSQHLLRATGFSSMEQLDTFLENHAIRTIPEHLRDPGYLNNFPESARVEDSKLVFGLNTAILTVLLNINAAVKTAAKEVCGRARRWSMVCDRLVDHIESQQQEPELRSMLSDARVNVNPAQVKDLVYG